MGLRLLSLLLPLAFLFQPSTCQTNTTKPYVEARVDFETECKTCPHVLCPNVLALEAPDPVNATCWTRGTHIVDTNLWIRISSGCYITEYDLGDLDYYDILPYCGPGSEDEDLTIEPVTLKYKTECNICPTITCDTISYLKEDTDLDVTCWTPDGSTIIDDPIWYKTSNNCYVAQKNLYSKPDITYLDNCGPIPFLQYDTHNNENGTSEVDKRSLPASSDSDVSVEAQALGGVLTPQYLINVTIGEDHVGCYTQANTTSKVQQRYEFNQTVWVQCVTDKNSDVWWSLTTDFCYVQSSDFWECPQCDCELPHSYSPTLLQRR